MVASAADPLLQRNRSFFFGEFAASNRRSTILSDYFIFVEEYLTG
jgi:hypothetical protein